MARATLAELIEITRSMTDAGTADYSLGTANYWDDNHVQNILDRHRRDVYNEPLAVIEKWTGSGSVGYFEYQSAYGYLEQTSGGTAVFWLEDGVGTDIGTALWTADYIRGRITFGADTTGSVYYLTGRTYDLNAAAAEIWRSKASYFATRAFDFSTDNHRVSGGQIHEHCLKMAAHYDGMALSTTTVLMRGDIDEYALD